MTTAPLSMSNPPDGLCRNCGLQTIKPFAVGDRWIYPPICDDCTESRRQRLMHIEQQRQEQLRQHTIAQRIEQTIPPLYRHARMEHLSQGLRQQLTTVGQDCGVYLFGDVGSGKSYALSALARSRIEAGCCVCLKNWERFLAELRQQVGQQQPGKADRCLRPAMTCDTLLLDDVGIAAAESDFALRTLYTLLDSRIENRKPTFLTSNRSPDEIGKSFDARIVSRILGHCRLIRLSAPDRRLKPARR